MSTLTLTPAPTPAPAAAVPYVLRPVILGMRGSILSYEYDHARNEYLPPPPPAAVTRLPVGT